MEITISEAAVKNIQQIQIQTDDPSPTHVVETALQLALTLLTKRNEGYKIVLEKKGVSKVVVEF
jgi:hypothetical protein